MNKITSLLLLGLLIVNIQTAFAATQKNAASNSFDNAVKEYNFEDNSYNISDEQLKTDSGEQLLENDRKTSFWSKIINSGYFSSNTATRTWIPLNKAE